jgi:CheY-like chemotaxis protein
MPDKGGNLKPVRRGAANMSLSVEDRFRFTMIVSFVALALVGLGAMFYISDLQAKKFHQDAVNLAVNRWAGSDQNGLNRLNHLIQPRSEESDENAPAILESNRVILRALLPDNLSKSPFAFTHQANGDVVWVVNRHPLLESNLSLILGEKDYPELKISREALVFQRWLATALLIVLLFSCAIFFAFSKHYIFKPLNLLRDSLLSRRLTDAARVKQLHNSKITIERLEEHSRFPLEQFEGDEFGQIAFILEEQDRKQKTTRENWLKSFNTVNEPIAIFAQNARLKFVNEAMEQFLDEIGLDPDLVLNLQAAAFLNSYLQLEEEIASKLVRVLNQKHPKVQGTPCAVELPEGSRRFHYSISTIVNHGERFAVFALVREQILGNTHNIEDVILEQANSQLKIIHRLQNTAREISGNKADSLLHMCEALIDNIHSLLEISNATNPSLATHKVEFNVFQFFREIQESSDGSMKVNVELEKSLPTFVVGDPTHLRQFLKGIFQSCQETNSFSAITMNIGYSTNEKKLVISILSPDGSAVLRDPSLQIYLSHYSPFLSLSNTADDELQNDEFIRIQISVQAGMNRIEAFDLDLSGRQLPQSLLIVSDDILPEEARELIDSSQQLKCEWLTPADALDRQFSNSDECMLLFISNTQKLKEKQIQKVINHVRSTGTPAILMSQQPRRGESLTAMRLGFVGYLTLPFEQDELQKLLILTMNKSVRDSIGKMGLLTKHTVRDLVPSLGKVLLGNIAKSHQKDALVLSNTLTNLGFKVHETSTVHSFFELLHKGSFEYIAFPEELSTGLKRRIQVGCRDIPCVLFGEERLDDTNRGDESRSNGGAMSFNWVRITDVGNPEVVKEALKVAQEKERTFSEPQEGLDETPENVDEIYEIAI